MPVDLQEFERQSNFTSSMGLGDEDLELARLYYSEVFKFRGWEVPNVYVMY